MTDANPWLIGPDQHRAEPEVESARPAHQVRLGASAPQPGVAVPDAADRLPRRSVTASATVWWLGVHGGAGESTLAALTAGTRPADHAWPIPADADSVSRVVLVARSNYSGLIAAQRAATEWAANTVGDGVQLIGLVLMADAPGRRPKPLRELEQVIAGGVPRVWTLPWVDAWRVGPASPTPRLPKEFRELFTDLPLPPNTPAHN